MSKSRSHHIRTAVVGLVVLAGPLVLSVGGHADVVRSTKSATKGSTQLSVNQSLRAELPAAIRRAGVLQTAGSETGLPVIGMETNGKWDGYLATITDEIGQVLGVKIAWSDPGASSSASALTALAAGRYDIVAEGLGDTLPREVTYNFVDYVDNVQALIVSNPNPAGVTDIPQACGKTFGLVNGSGNHTIGLNAWCEAHGLPPAIPDVFNSSSAELTALQSGQVAESGGPTLSEVWTANHGGGIKVITANFGGSKAILGTQIFGYVTTKTSTGKAIDKAVLGALKELVANGDYLAALKKWGAQGEALTGSLHVGINVGKQGTQFFNPMSGG